MVIFTSFFRLSSPPPFSHFSFSTRRAPLSTKPFSKKYRAMDPSELNNQAIADIRDNYFDEAISTLTKALKRIRLVMSRDAMIADTTADDDGDGEAMVTGEDTDGGGNSPRASCFEFFTCGSSSFLTSVEDGRISSKSMFRDPMHLSSSTVSDCQIEHCEKLSCVIIYNLALAHHLRAMEEQSEQSRQSRLRKALTLYEHAHHILVSQEIDVSLLHSMAIACNLGHIHHMTGNEPVSQMYFQHLLSAILCVVDCGEGGKPLDGFVRNVMELIVFFSSAPAA
jgi:hypothetical protein